MNGHRSERAEVRELARLCELSLKLAWHWENRGQRSKARTVAKTAQRCSDVAFDIARGVRHGR